MTTHTLHNATAIKPLLMDGKRLTLTVEAETRNAAQNALLHALFADIAQRREWCGRKWPMEVWKRLLVAAWCRANGESVEVVPALDGHGVDVVFRRTSKLSKADCASLTGRGNNDSEVSSVVAQPSAAGDREGVT